ncbi:MAG: nucleotide exchange factor GrpE [Candidatus Muiribacteriota bacterium]
MKKEKIIENLNHFKSKTKNIKKCIKEVLEDYDYKKEDKNNIIEEFTKNFENLEIDEKFFNRFLEERNMDEKKFIQKYNKAEKDFFKEIIKGQLEFYNSVKNREKYFQEIEKEVEELRAQKKKTDDSLKEYIELSSRLKRDYDNLSRRSEKEKEQIQKNSAREICKSVVDILDNFDNALNGIKNQKEEKISKKDIINGLELIEKKIKSILTKEGVEEIKSLNEKFDHNLHEAIDVEEYVDLEEDDTVVEEFKKGFMFKGAVLRPALVKVGKKVDKKAETKES